MRACLGVVIVEGLCVSPCHARASPRRVLVRLASTSGTPSSRVKPPRATQSRPEPPRAAQSRPEPPIVRGSGRSNEADRQLAIRTGLIDFQPQRIATTLRR